MKEKKEKNEFEILCYETEDGAICLEFGEAAISFSKKRFLEFAGKLNEISDSVLREYLRRQNSERSIMSSYRI
jgi:hypothetical protein